MTIREQSELSFIGYMLKVTTPHALSILSNSFKDSVPFFYNALWVVSFPITIPLAAFMGIRRDKTFVKEQDMKRSKL